MKKTKRALPACTPANSVTENDLKIGDQQGFLQSFTVMETTEGYYIVAMMHGKNWYVVTRRVRTQPRMYQNLHRLSETLKEQFPKFGFTLLRDREIPDPDTSSDAAIVPNY